MVSVNTHKDLVTVVESMQRSIKTLEGSAVGPQTLEEKADMRKPSAPLSFRGSSSVKFNPDGTTTSIINCYWDSVHFSNGYEDTFYTLIKIKSYEIWAHRLDIEDDDWSVIYTIEQPPFAANDDGSITPITVSAVVPVIGGGILYELRVCAIGQDYNNYGDWSQVIQVTSANDLDAPDIPSSPVVSEQANLASVMWNGLPVMPIDFAYCEVGFSEYITTDPDIFGRLYTTENAVVVTPIYDKTCYYYLRSVDFSSNHSVWSTPTSFNISSPETGPEEDAIKDWIDSSQKETQDNINKVAQDAAAASQAIKDASIVNTQDFWAVSTSETNPPTSGWSSTAPIRTPGSFIWVKTVITFGSGSTTETTPVLLTGNTGVGVEDTTVEYCYSISGTEAPTAGWSSTLPNVEEEKFLWTKTTTTYTDSTYSISYSVSRSGTIGRSITESKTEYQISSSGTTPPTGTWLTTVPVQTTALPYLWTRTTFTYSDSTTSLAYSVSKIGVGIESLKSYYQLKNSSSDSTNYLPSWTTTKQIVKTNLIPNSGAVNNDGSWYAKTSTENIASTSEFALWSDSSRSIVFTNTTIEDFSLNLKIPGPNILTLGKTYTASFSINSPYSTKISSLSVSTTGGGTIPHIQQIPDSSLIELSGNYPIKLNVTFIATSDIVSGNAVVYSSWYPENTNQTIEVSMGDLYEGPYQPDRVWFNGSYSSNNIYTPSWVGTINNSASTLSANVINELAQNQCYAILDDDNDIILMSKESATSSEQYVSFTLPQDLKYGGYISTIVTIENVLTGVLNSSWGTVGIESTNYKTNNPVNSIDSYSRDLVFDTVNSNLDIILYLGGYGSLIFSDLQLLYAKPDHLSIPSKPTTLEPSSDWQDTEPTYRKNTILYRVERVLYSDGTFSYTEPYVSTAYQAANAAMSAANLVDAAMQGLIQMSTTEPLDPVQGSIWFELDEETENIIGLYIYTGGSWVPYTIIANKLLVPGSVGVVTIEEGAVEGLLGAFDTVLSDLLYSTKIKAEHIELGEITKNLLDSELSHTVNDAAEWAKKTTLEPGKITISAGESTGTSLIMTPTKLSFIVGNIEVAYIDSTKQELNIKKAVIKESLKVGYHILEKYTDSVTIMRWVGA